MGRTFWTLQIVQAFLQLKGGASDSQSALSESSRGSLPPQTPFLLEIVSGRCFDRPPTGHARDATMCPVIAPSLIGVLQGSLDEAISVESFESYWKSSDFASPPDHALLIMDGEENLQVASIGQSDDDGSDKEEDYFLPPSLIRPENTPGGSLLKGLVFCGVDEQRTGCDFAGAYTEDDGSVRFPGAQTSFWAGVYRSFAASVTGRLRIVVLGADEADVEEEEEKQQGPNGNPLVSQETLVKNQLVLLSAIPNLPIRTEVDVFSQCSCERPIVAKVMKALELRGMKATCTYDRGLMHFFRSAGYFIGDDPFSPLSTSSSVMADGPLLKRKGRFHVLRSAAVGIGMLLAAAATVLLGLMLRSKRPDRGRYDTIPTNILLQ